MCLSSCSGVDTKLLFSTKVGEEERTLGSYHEPVVPWSAGLLVQRHAQMRSITTQTVVAVHEVGRYGMEMELECAGALI